MATATPTAPVVLVADVLTARARERMLWTSDVRRDDDGDDHLTYLPVHLPGMTAADLAPLPG
jgi:hypothetical protein